MGKRAVVLLLQRIDRYCSWLCILVAADATIALQQPLSDLEIHAKQGVTCAAEGLPVHPRARSANVLAASIGVTVAMPCKYRCASSVFEIQW